MDIVLLNSSVFSLPTSRRAGAVVYDGTTDLELWRPPGPDRELLQAYGDALEATLARERGQLPRRKLALLQALRLHPGKLRCDYLIWVGARPPHGDDEQAAACSPQELERATRAALELADKHHTSRVALGVLGAGPAQAEGSERLAAIVRGANAFREACKKQGRAPSIEEVLVCSPSTADIAKARRATDRLARQAPSAPVITRSAPPVRSSRAPASSVRPSRSPGEGARRSSRVPRLDPMDVQAARTRAEPYDRGQMYFEGAWLIHPKFGVGQVRVVQLVEGMMTVLFEDGEQRRLLHAGR